MTIMEIQFEPRPMVYATSNLEIMIAKSLAEQEDEYIREDYTFQDEPGKTDRFHDMCKLMQPNDTLYISGISVFFHGSTSDFIKSLTTICDKGVHIHSCDEPDFDCDAYMKILNMTASGAMYDVARSMLQSPAQPHDDNANFKLVQASGLYRTGELTLPEIFEQTDVDRQQFLQLLSDYYK